MSIVDVDETQLFLDIEGVNKKHRVYGLGLATGAYIDTSRSRAHRVRSSRPSSSSQPDASSQVISAGRRCKSGCKRKCSKCKRSGKSQMYSQMQARMHADMQAQMADFIRAEVAKMMPTLPPEHRPPPRDDNDEDES